eukprot:152511_1
MMIGKNERGKMIGKNERGKMKESESSADNRDHAPNANLMSMLSHAETTPLGTPKMIHPSEVIIFTGERFGLYQFNVETKAAKEVVEDAVLTLTSHRIVWIGGTGSSKRHVFSLDLRLVDKVVPHHKKRFRHSKKLDLYLKMSPSHYPCGLIRWHGSQSEVMPHLELALRRKVWENTTAAQVLERRMETGLRTAGVGAVLERQRRTQQAMKDMEKEAFGDLDSLMDQAKDVIAVINRFSVAQQKKTCSSPKDDFSDELSQPQGSKGNSRVEEEDSSSSLESIIVSIGLVNNPITKASAGGEIHRYHTLLAQQLVDFILERGLLARFGGVLALTDIYSLFNRARGTELVSPKDLLAVTSQMEGMGLRLRTFPSGVLALEAEHMNDTEMGQKLVALAWKGITAAEVSRAVQLPLLLAREHLVMAEKAGLLCRDDTLEGLRFFPNRFSEW